MNPTIRSVMSMTSTSSNNGTGNLSDPEKQQRLELLTYAKAHFDLIAVTLLVGYLGFALYNEFNKNK
jgi:hypothetical protein